MTAADILKALVAIGTSVHDAFAKTQRPAASLADFVNSLDIKTLGPEVVELINSLSQQDSRAAVAEIDAKQTTLLAGRTFDKLSVHELTQYSALSRARLVLTTRNLKEAMNPSFLEWLVEDALPPLINVLPTLVQLLL